MLWVCWLTSRSVQLLWALISRFLTAQTSKSRTCYLLKQKAIKRTRINMFNCIWNQNKRQHLLKLYIDLLPRAHALSGTRKNAHSTSKSSLATLNCRKSSLLFRLTCQLLDRVGENKKKHRMRKMAWEKNLKNHSIDKKCQAVILRLGNWLPNVQQRSASTQLPQDLLVFFHCWASVK